MHRILFILAFASLLLVACSKPDPEPQNSSSDDVDVPAPNEAPAKEPVALAPPPAAANAQMPAPYTNAEIREGECMSPVDFVNDSQPSNLTAQAAGAELTVIGWNMVSKDQGLLPEAIFAVLKPYDSSHAGVVLTGKRTERPDVAAGNPEYLMTGYEAKGPGPGAAGKYRIVIRTGTSLVLYECDTQVDVVVR